MSRRSIAAQIKTDEKVYADRLREIVEKSIKEEKTIMDAVENPHLPPDSLGQRLADKVASFGGSWKFILLFTGFLVLWIVFNSIAMLSLRFDPYPFILMNLVLSCIAAMQAPIIMMSQNRQEEKDRKRSENDYMINLKAEMQIRRLHEKLDLLEQEEIRSIFETQQQQLELLKRIEKKLETMKPNHY